LDVHRNHLRFAHGKHSGQPSFCILGRGRMLRTGPLDTTLDFRDGHDRRRDFLSTDLGNPGHHGRVRLLLSKRAQDIGVQDEDSDRSAVPGAMKGLPPARIARMARSNASSVCSDTPSDRR
jgi:hypothetical protein